MSIQCSHQHPLTPGILLKDKLASELGYWCLDVKLQRRKDHYIIVKDVAEGYTLAKCRPLTIVGHGENLEKITSLFNSLLSKKVGAL